MVTMAPPHVLQGPALSSSAQRPVQPDTAEAAGWQRRTVTSSVCAGRQCVSTWRGGWGMLPISFCPLCPQPQRVWTRKLLASMVTRVSSEGKRKAVGCWEGRDMAGAQGCLGLSSSCKQANSQQTGQVKRLQTGGQGCPSRLLVRRDSPKEKGLDCGF